MTSSIYPCLWFDGQAKAAAEFYCGIFPNARIIDETPLVVSWEINGNKFMGLNGGPHFKFNESVSFVIDCDTQEEIDFFWEKLTHGGAEGMCGWCKDKFGVSWQIVPTLLGALVAEKGQAVVDAFLEMRKFDIEVLKAVGIAETIE